MENAVSSEKRRGPGLLKIGGWGVLTLAGLLAKAVPEPMGDPFVPPRR